MTRLTVCPSVGHSDSMSILSGILSGGGLLMSALGAALDESHHPFKRATYRPGGPAKKADAEVSEWQCEWMKPTPKAYRQRCYNIHNPDRKPKTVKISKAYKKRYNKAYRAGKFPHGGPFKKDVRAAAAAYAPAKSRTWAAAGKKKAGKGARKSTKK